MRHFLIIFVCATATVAEKFKCPQANGTFADALICDKFYDCKENVVMEHLCPEGLVFGEDLKRFGKCDQPFNVDCGNRTISQLKTNGTVYCPKKNGFFPHIDDSNCDTFYICDEGQHSETKCVDGLHFDAKTGTCTWPNVINRENCKKPKITLKDGFSCPKNKGKDASGQIIVHPQYPHPTDCQRFYVCANGVDPTELRCDDGEVFNDEISRCDAPANSPGCEDWFISK